MLQKHNNYLVSYVGFTGLVRAGPSLNDTVAFHSTTVCALFRVPFRFRSHPLLDYPSWTLLLPLVSPTRFFFSCCSSCWTPLLSPNTYVLFYTEHHFVYVFVFVSCSRLAEHHFVFIFGSCSEYLCWTPQICYCFNLICSYILLYHCVQFVVVSLKIHWFWVSVVSLEIHWFWVA